MTTGNPRLVFNIGSADWNGEPAREVALTEEVTTIGSADSATLQLAGIEAEAARIVLEDDDEFVLYLSGEAAHGLDGDPHDPADHREVLRSGAKLQLGDWSMFFQREGEKVL
jgi:hypothetical protein